MTTEQGYMYGANKVTLLCINKSHTTKMTAFEAANCRITNKHYS